MLTTTQAAQQPKSYLATDRRARLFKEGGEELVYLAESNAAGKAGDEDAAWEWMRKIELPASTLRYAKAIGGAGLIRRQNLNKKKADEEFGQGWLDRG